MNFVICDLGGLLSTLWLSMMVLLLLLLLVQSLVLLPHWTLWTLYDAGGIVIAVLLYCYSFCTAVAVLAGVARKAIRGLFWCRYRGWVEVGRPTYGGIMQKQRPEG